MKRTTSKSSSRSKKVRVKYKFDTKDNTILKDYTNPKAKLKMIFDKDEPFYKHTHTEE